MKKIFLIAVFFIACNNSQLKEPLTNKNMEIRSTFNQNEEIPAKYTCDGEDINPPLNFDKIPAETKSLALIVDDPDAPIGVWTHWTIWNISPDVKSIAENSTPKGIEGITSTGETGYGGPCPPSGVHRYFFKLYALDTTLNIESEAKVEDLENAMEGHILDKAELMGRYKRQN